MATTSELQAGDVAGQGNICKIQISLVLLQDPTTLLALCYHSVFALHRLPLLLRKVLKADEAFLCFTGSLLPQAKDTERCNSLRVF